MLFNSFEFILLFLPIVLVVFYTAGRLGHHRIGISWLVGASLFFYGWWNPLYLFLILISILFNYTMGVALGKSETMRSKLFLSLGIAVNLAALFYFKYANFLVDNYNVITNSSYHLEKVILPLAISFFTFQQISYLVDAYRGETQEYDFIHYCLFVTFFPQLIAGPIVHHKEMLPQFCKKRIFKFRLHLFLLGLSIFFIGLFKKVIIADTIATYSTPVFNAASSGSSDITFFSAWGGALAYTFQLYYDFSGYSDMAIGIALFFGIRLPLNFYSPYKATNMIDFWKRWHMTLSRFLRDYLYISLGGNRKGKVRKYFNLFITMLLGGFWHGAGWTFVVWGALHGLYLMINHAWIALCPAKSSNLNLYSVGRHLIGCLLTFVAVTVAWVFFRAEDIDAALAVLKGMVGLNGFILPSRLLPILNQMGSFGNLLVENGVKFSFDPVFGQWGYPLLLVLIAFTWLAPNTRQFMVNYSTTINDFVESYPRRFYRFKWRLNQLSAVFVAILTFLAFIGLNEVSEFLYFQF